MNPGHSPHNRPTPRTTVDPSVAQLVESCQGLVRSLAWKIHQRVGRMVELDDLISYGQLGLVEAAKSFDASRGYAFTTFAHHRIRGAILDGLSKLSWFSPHAYHASRYEAMADELQSEENDPDETDEAWFARKSRTLAVAYIVSGEASSALAALTEGSEPAPAQGLLDDEARQCLRRAIDSLPAQSAQLIRWTYFEGMTLTDAAKRMGISKAWASRLHARTLDLLAENLRSAGIDG